MSEINEVTEPTEVTEVTEVNPVWTAAERQAFLDDFQTMSTFGATPGGGVDRQAATAQDGQTRAWFANVLQRFGMRVDQDGIGNLFGFADFVPDAPYVLVGSHLDSQPLAGRFDGAYGVLSAAHAVHHVVRRLRESGQTPAYNLAVVDWFNEEGSRFKPSMMGSAVFCGTLPQDTALQTTDPAGTSVQEALTAISGIGELAGVPVAAYAEVHVEQGRSLEESGHSIGVVHSTWCAHKYEVRVSGEQAHTGSAQMRDRRDALLAGSRVVSAVHDLIAAFPVEDLHATVSEFTVWPNSPVTIAREVRMLIDLRAPREEVLNEAFAQLQKSMDSIDTETGCRTEISSRTVWNSGPFLAEGVALVESVSAAAGYPSNRVLTLAGHDATNVKEIAPTVLFFVPSVDGISHNERELTSDEHLIAGAEVLTGVVEQLAHGGLRA